MESHKNLSNYNKSWQIVISKNLLKTTKQFYNFSKLSNNISKQE